MPIFEEGELYEELVKNLPGLMYLKDRHEMYRIDPTGVIVPARLKPELEGEAFLMGLPVTWVEGEQWGLITHLPKPKE